MFQKYLIVASKKDTAGMNITAQLSQFRENPVLSSMKENSPGFDFYLVEDEILYTENFDLGKINNYDFIIFASKHKSEKNEKTLSIHAPGNWRQAEFGGEPEKVCKTSALFQKQLFERLNANVKEYYLDKYKITLECTHHGPLIEPPCLFIEIGSTEEEWKDRRAGFIIAKTISDTIKDFKVSRYNEIAIGVGGPHYCPSFNKIQEKSNIAISHVIPGYIAPITEQMIKQAIEKTQEEVDLILIDWKSFKSAQRQELLDILKKFYIQWKKTSEIKK